MDFRPLGRTGIRISQLCFGTMTFGAEADEAISADLFRRCRDAGINCFDTADAYAKGRSEEILGHLMAGARDELVIASKFTKKDLVDSIRDAGITVVRTALESSAEGHETNIRVLAYMLGDHQIRGSLASHPAGRWVL